MAEHSDRPVDKGADGSPGNPPAETGPAGTRVESTGPAATTQARGRRLPVPRRMPDAGVRKGAAGLVATIISVITTIVVVVLAVHVLFVVFEANASNDIVSTVRDWADDLAWQFKDIFEPKDAKFRVAVNYGLAALVYLIIGRAVVNLIRRLG